MSVRVLHPHGLGATVQAQLLPGHLQLRDASGCCWALGNFVLWPDPY